MGARTLMAFWTNSGEGDDTLEYRTLYDSRPVFAIIATA